jgi:hypothetical protein
MALHEVNPSISSNTCCIANSILDYVSKAVNLGQNKTLNKLVSNGIEERKYRIYDDAQTSFEWARFLSRALGVVRLFDLEEGGAKVEDGNVDQFLSKELEYVPEVWQEDWFVQEEVISIQKRWRDSKMEEALLLF